MFTRDIEKMRGKRPIDGVRVLSSNIAYPKRNDSIPSSWLRYLYFRGSYRFIKETQQTQNNK